MNSLCRGLTLGCSLVLSTALVIDTAKADGGPVGDSRPDTSTLGRSMLVDRVAPNAIPFPTGGQPSAPVAKSSTPAIEGKKTEPGVIPVVVGGRSRRQTGLTADPLRVVAPLSIVSMLGAMAYFAVRRSHK